MKNRTAAALIAFALIPSMSMAKEKRVDLHADVDGASYRVTVVNDDKVLVARKALFVAYDLYERDRQRKAVTIATGCEIVDELPSNDARLRGRLDCSKKH